MRTDYDETPYPSLPYAQTHPDRMATIATLLGLQPVPVTRCRVLELGAAAGGNLYPMAYALPDSQFVGIDYSQAQVTEGQRLISHLGLTNITLLKMDIMDIMPEFGQFDYIIAHGIYSWVPAPVRDRVMQVCKQNLAPNGIAYISYNSYPGWHMMAVIRDAMLYHTRNISDQMERVTEARALLEFMSAGVPAENSAFGVFLQSYTHFLQGELKGATASGNAFLLHDELEEVNDPVYFSQFMNHADQHGLQYLAEADFADVFPKGYPDETMAKLQMLSHDIIEMEQYLDFLRSKMFRQTLLCHADRTVQRTLTLNRAIRLYASSRIKPVSETPDIEGVSVEKFSNGGEEITLSTDHPVSKTALVHLAEIWPRAVRISDLLNIACRKIHAAPDRIEEDAQDLLGNMLKAYTYSSQLVELHSYHPQLVTAPTERPLASPVARLGAEEGLIATNMWHERAHLTPFSRQVLRLLDGTCDREGLLDKLTDLAIADVLHLKLDGEPVSDPAVIRPLLARELEPNLEWLGRAGTLIG